MARQIESYRSKSEDRDVKSSNNFKFSANTIFMIITLAALIWNSGADACEVIKGDQLSKTQQSKLCMAEYSQSACDALKLTTKCADLLNCIQLKDGGIIDIGIHFFRSFANEILEDYHLSAVIFGFLLLLRLIDTVKDSHDKNS